MTTTHTPGPWQARIGMAKWNVTTCDKPRSFNICTVNTDRIQQEANARLIAAAPDLLAALETALDVMGEWGEDGDPAWAEWAREVIAKAKGA